MSINSSFAYHVNVLCKKCTDLSGWIVRTFTFRDSTTQPTTSGVNRIVSGAQADQLQTMMVWCCNTALAIDTNITLV